MRQWEKAEERVRRTLEREFGVPLRKQSIRLGRLVKEFDAVSDDRRIVAMVKAFDRPYGESTPMQLKTRQDRCIVDCAWLASTTAEAKLMVFVERDYAEWFRPYCDLLFPEVTVRWIG